MEARFSDLLSTVCHNTEELRRFRQVRSFSLIAASSPPTPYHFHLHGLAVLLPVK